MSEVADAPGSYAAPGRDAEAPAAAPPRPLRIEMVVPSLPAAGMEMMVVALARALARRGHGVGVTCLRELGPLAAPLQADGVPVSLVAAPGVRSNFRAPVLARHLAGGRPDVVHSHSGVWGPAAVAGAAAGARVIHTVHGLLDHEPWHGPLLKRWAARRTAAVAAVSDPLREYLVGPVGLPAARVLTLPNGIDTLRFAPPAIAGREAPTLRARLGVDAGRRLVGILARFAPVKNHALLLDAFARIAAAHPDADLVLIGDGELRPAIEAQIARLDLGARVHLPGITDDPAPWYRELDVFVLCSVAEGTSMSVLEAMATGLPVVGTAVGGTPALLDGGAAGVLVPSRDPAALADAIDALLRDPARRAALGAAARARACARYSADRMVRTYEQLYRGGRPADADR